MPTPHNAAQHDDIAKIVLMPGDPLRAKKIADSYLDNVHQFNSHRNMFGYTGKYEGKPISVMGSGMGMPSIGIYSYELFKEYDVDVIIRVGSCGALRKDLKLYDIILVDAAFSLSTYAQTAFHYYEKLQFPDKLLNQHMRETARDLSMPLHSGNIYSSDVFYSAYEDDQLNLGVENDLIAVEMESFALFSNARYLQKQAACLLTVSDSIVNHETTTAEERQDAFTQMMELALSCCMKQTT